MKPEVYVEETDLSNDECYMHKYCNLIHIYFVKLEGTSSKSVCCCLRFFHHVYNDSKLGGKIDSLPNDNLTNGSLALTAKTDAACWLVVALVPGASTKNTIEMLLLPHCTSISFHAPRDNGSISAPSAKPVLFALV